jgi:hypothetical protein
MRYRKAVILCLLGTALLFGGRLVHLPRRPRPQVTEENFRKLKRGVTRADVEAVLGGPPGDYGRFQRAYHVCACEWPPCTAFYDMRHDRKEPAAEEIDAVAAREGLAIWWGAEEAIAVQFNEDGKVASLGYGVAMREPGFWDSIWDWVGEWEWVG